MNSEDSFPQDQTAQLEAVIAPVSSAPSPVPATEGTFNLRELERRIILKALDATGANRTRAAVLLGISRRTLQRKLKEYGLIRSTFKEATPVDASS